MKKTFEEVTLLDIAFIHLKYLSAT